MWQSVLKCGDLCLNVFFLWGWGRGITGVKESQTKTKTTRAQKKEKCGTFNVPGKRIHATEEIHQVSSLRGKVRGL